MKKAEKKLPIARQKGQIVNLYEVTIADQWLPSCLYSLDSEKTISECGLEWEGL